MSASATPPGGRPLWLLLPGGALLLAVIGIPFALGLWISLLDLDQYTLRRWLSAPFIGLANYAEALAQTSLLRSVWISISYAVIGSAICVPLGVAAALATQDAFAGRGLIRSLFLVPYVLPMFVVATIWRTALQPDGVVNAGLGRDTLWLNGPATYPALIFVIAWASWPFVYLLVLAGLQSVPTEVHEAAAIDGSGWWSKLRYVVFPHVRGQIALGFLISVLHMVNNFTLPFVMFGIPAPDDVNVLPMLTYITSFQTFRFGLSAAMAVVSLLLVSLPLLIYLRAIRLDVGDGVR